METTKQITVFNLYLHIAFVLSLTLCGPNNVLEIEVGISNNTFTCEGLQSNESVIWSFSQPSTDPIELQLGDCQPLSTSGEPCRSIIPEIFYLQRILNTSSDVIVNGSYPNIKERLVNSRMKCAAMHNSETCSIDTVYPAEGVMCSVKFRSGTWSLVAHCNISTAYSSLSRYWCQWFLMLNTQEEAIFISKTNIAYNTSSTSGNITGFCILNASLPLDNGIYTVDVGITPGNKNFTSTFIGNNTIYRPSVLPNINCTDNNGQYAQEGADLICICTASNLGQPPGRLVFHWHTNAVIYGNYSEKQVLTIQRVTRQDNRAVIKCVLEWATRNENLYVNYTIAVAYPPQTPGIAYGGQQYPFMEGDTCTLFCGFSTGADRGNPPAHLAWQGQPVTIMGTDSSNVTLTLHPLNKTHNGQNFVCDAVNNFTAITNSRVSANVTIEVYYRPILTLSALPDTRCLNKSTSWQCVLVDGQFIDVNCTADSNPRPRTTFWRTAGFTLLSNQSENLRIVSANHSLHTGIYFCNATTEGNVNDSRLPLSSESELHIMVKYKVEQISMSLNFAFGDVVVNEHEHLIIECQANGRPTPMLLLYKGNTSSQLLHRIPGGILTIRDERSVLSYSINSLHCENSSVYICIARNEVENSSIIATQQLYVNCAPRIVPNSPFPKEITFYGDPVPVIFEVIAYPKITKAYIKATDNASSMIVSDVNMKFPLMCDESSLLYTSLCILVIKNATSADVGTYQMTLINGIGDLTIKIQIFVNIKDHCARCQENRDEGLSPGASAGITLAVEAVVAALVMVILWRKGFILNCREKHADRSIKTNSEIADWSNTKSDMHVESCLDLPSLSSERGTNSQYEGLRVGEIGLTPAYESLKQETKCRAETGEKLSSYETLQIRDIGAVSHYDSIQPAQNVNILHSTGHVYSNS